MNPQSIFSLANTLAFLGWLLLVFAPGSRISRRVVRSGYLSWALAIVYWGALVSIFRTGLPEGAGFGSLAQVSKLFTNEWGLLAGWVHYLCFDLLLGAQIVTLLENHPSALRALALVLTFLFGPVGWSLGFVLSRTPTRGRSLAVAAGLTLLLAVVTSVGVLADPRVVAGQNLWIKPLKFAISIAVFLYTIEWVLKLFPEKFRQAWSWRFIVLMALELAPIYFQACRGRPSHHNNTTPLDSILYGVMGVSIMVNTVLLAVLAFRLWKRRKESPYVLSTALGLVLTVLGSFIGAAMSARGGHTVGAPDGGPGLLLLNWSTQHGDLRAAHFLGIHGIQILMIFGHLVTIRFRRSVSDRRARALVIVAFFSCAIVTGIALAQALSGTPTL